jgi:hypothetical protein
VAISGVAWLAWAAAFGDRSTAMVVALSATCAACAAFISGLSRGGARAVVATAAFGATPVIALATLRALSEPLMGSAFTDGAARQREGVQAVILAVILAALCAGAAAFIARRRLERRRASRWVLAALTWAPLVAVPALLGLAVFDSFRAPTPERYGTSQPVLAHMDPESSGGALVVDELERKEGITLVRVCQDTPWCYTLLRRGDKVTTRPGYVHRQVPVHLRYDPNHELYLVESGGQLVSTVNARNLASYDRLLPHHVRHSLTPPPVYSLLAAIALVGAIVILWRRRSLRRTRDRVDAADAGVCFGDGWGLLADGTTMRVPPDVERGSILVLWSEGRERTMTLLEGTREEIARRIEERRQALDAVQMATMWTLCTPLAIAVAVI